MSKVNVSAIFNRNPASVRLAVDTSEDFSSPVFSTSVTPENKTAKFHVDSLSAGTAYYCAVEVNGNINKTIIGQFTTPQSGAQSFKCAFAGDASTGSNHPVFDQVRSQAPSFFLHLGDAHYENISTDDPGLFRAAYDSVFGASRQSQLYREVPTIYVFDDHDYGPNDSDASSASRPAALQVYRERVPHFDLVETADGDPIYHAFEIGRVMFIVTDQRSMADDWTDTDDASKTMLGAAQKQWFKDLLSDVANDEKLFVWVCPRVFGGVDLSDSDHWGHFSTERTELCDHIQANASGRVIVLSADMHSLAIDDGTNHDFVTSGSEPIPTFQAAPLDRESAQTHGGATYSEGQFTNNGQFGLMEVTDTGGSTITVDWTGYDSEGTMLVTHQILVTV